MSRSTTCCFCQCSSASTAAHTLSETNAWIFRAWSPTNKQESRKASDEDWYPHQMKKMVARRREPIYQNDKMPLSCPTSPTAVITRCRHMPSCNVDPRNISPARVTCCYIICVVLCYKTITTTVINYYRNKMQNASRSFPSTGCYCYVPTLYVILNSAPTRGYTVLLPQSTALLWAHRPQSIFPQLHNTRWVLPRSAAANPRHSSSTRRTTTILPQ